MEKLLQKKVKDTSKNDILVKTISKKLLYVFLSLLILSIFIPFNKVIAENYGDFDVTGSKSGVSFSEENKKLTIEGITSLTTNYTIKMKTGITKTSNHIEINPLADCKEINVTIENLNIDVSSTVDTSAFKISCDSTVKITLNLEGKNFLKSSKGQAGLNKNGKNDLIITGIGQLVAIGGFQAAGIGGNLNANSQNITINGGTITAIGGDQAAGIGGGYNGNMFNLTINDGIITATGGNQAAGIGGGYNGNLDTLTITGGSITATSGDLETAGIGKGHNGFENNFIIKGGKINCSPQNPKLLLTN